MRPFTIAEFFAARTGLLPLPVYDAFHAVLLGRSVALAAELGIFEALDGARLVPDAVAERTRTHPEASRLLLGALEAAGYLTARGDAYTLARATRRWLAPSSPDNLLWFLRYVALVQRKWGDLGDTAKAGRPRSHYAETFTAGEWRTYVLGMRDLSRLLLRPLLRFIGVPPDAARLLDVGGSHGSYTVALCERHPRLHGVIADLPPALEITRELVAASPAAGRISLAGLDLTRDEIPAPASDIVLAINIVHGFSAAQNAALFGKLSAALSPGGRLYICDQFPEAGARGTRRLLPFLVGLNLMNEAGGTAHTIGAVGAWCRAAGLRVARTGRLGLPGVGVVVAVREGSTGG